jgi:hypothetical protein
MLGCTGFPECPCESIIGPGWPASQRIRRGDASRSRTVRDHGAQRTRTSGVHRMPTDKVIANQNKIISNQNRIQRNQAKLDKLLANQKEIFANQKKILANQKKLLSRKK